MRRLHQQKGSTPPTAATIPLSNKQQQGHKRTRRRRRTKKSYAGGGGASSSIGSSTATTAASTTGGFVTGGLGGAGQTLSRSPQGTSGATSKKQHDAPMTRRDLYFALRCGIVQVGPSAADTAVGRVTLVNWDNEIVVDTFVKVPPPITDYRTEVTGITADLLDRGACSLDSVRKKVGTLIRGKILIGHGLEVDLAALRLSHPLCDMRDTATYPPFMHQMDPMTRMLLPRTLEDLMQHALQQPVLPGQPLLVSEATACLSLYKAAREQWERELILLMQQKERQRELVMNMRSGPARNGESIGGPVLSRIAEDAAGEEVCAPANYYARRLEDTDHERFSWRESNEYETSTLASDRTAFDNYELYRDDISESSFVTNESELDVGFRRPTMNAIEADLNPLFENLHMLPEFNQSMATYGTQQTLGSSTVAGSSHLEEWTIRGGSLGTSQHSGIWSPLPSTSAVNSLATADWSQDSPRAMVRSHTALEHTGNINPEGFATTSVSLTEEELREHLPAHLLDDLEVSSPNNKTSYHKEEGEEPKKKSWFGLGRRLRSMSVPSPAESIFGELKAGSKLSLSDRVPRRSRLFGEDPRDESFRSTENRAIAGQSVSSDDSSLLRHLPGF